MTVHLLACPNTQVTDAFPLDGFCRRTWLFADLLRRMGRRVTLYGVEQTTAPVDEFVSCVSESERTKMLGATEYQHCPFDLAHPLWMTFNVRANQAVRERKRPGDIVATIAGSAQQLVSEGNPDLLFLEYSIGYRGVTAPYRVFQSSAWRHVVMGFTGIDGGRESDAVIPPWFPVEDFPFQATPEHYVLYCGRLVPAKGLSTVCDAARAAGVPLKVIGHGRPELVTYGEYLGPVSERERNRLLAGARAVLMPTQYCEPFGNVAAEAQLCGTPVISTDYGGFTDSVAHGLSGYRCRTLGEFVQAIDLCGSLDRHAIRDRAISLYSTEAALVSYRRYFSMLDTARTDGWRDMTPALAEREPVG